MSEGYGGVNTLHDIIARLEQRKEELRRQRAAEEVEETELELARAESREGASAGISTAALEEEGTEAVESTVSVSTAESSGSTSATTTTDDFESVLAKCDILEPLPNKELHRLFDGKDSKFKTDETKEQVPEHTTKAVYYISRQLPILGPVSARTRATTLYPRDIHIVFSNSVEASEVAARDRLEYNSYSPLHQVLSSAGIELLGVQYAYKFNYRGFKDAKVTTSGDRQLYLQHLYRNAPSWDSSPGSTSYVQYGNCTYTWVNDKNELVTVRAKRQDDLYFRIFTALPQVRLVYRVQGQPGEFYSRWVVLTFREPVPENMTIEEYTVLQFLEPEEVAGETPLSVAAIISQLSNSLLPSEPISHAIQHRLSGEMATETVSHPIGSRPKFVSAMQISKTLHSQQETGRVMWLRQRLVTSTDEKSALSSSIFTWPYNDSSSSLVNPRKSI